MRHFTRKLELAPNILWPILSGKPFLIKFDSFDNVGNSKVFATALTQN